MPGLFSGTKLVLGSIQCSGQIIIFSYIFTNLDFPEIFGVPFPSKKNRYLLGEIAQAKNPNLGGKNDASHLGKNKWSNSINFTQICWGEEFQQKIFENKKTCAVFHGFLPIEVGKISQTNNS